MPIVCRDCGEFALRDHACGVEPAPRKILSVAAFRAGWRLVRGRADSPKGD
jgi:hypothetical protein